MPLHSDAQKLVAILQAVIEALERFRHPTGASYAADMAVRLRPLVANFEQAIQAHSREAASAALDEIKPLLHDVNGAATKGDLAIFPHYSDDTLNRYWQLETIFQETRYAGQSL
jgi:hypothetical protein